MAKIILTELDNYIDEPYNKRHGKPKTFLRCGYCDNYYEPVYHDGEDFVVCSNCGEVSFPYEEE